MTLFSSLRAKTTAIAVAGILISNAAGIALYLKDRSESLLLAEALDIAERAAGVSRLVRDLPLDWRAEVIQASDSRALRVWTSQTPVFDESELTDDEVAITAYVRSLVPRIAKNEIRVRLSLDEPKFVPKPKRSSEEMALTPEPSPGWNLSISIDHGNSEWLSFVGHMNSPRNYLSSFIVPSLFLSTMTVGLIAFWLVGRVTAPLYGLAAAADNFGRNIYDAPMDERGPDEVQIAARAFNEMRLRLIRLIEVRTEMLAGISHDLRTPITQTRLRLETMTPKSERVKAMRALDEMNAIIGTFLDYARATNDVENRSIVDIGVLAESICYDFTDVGEDVSFQGEGRQLALCRPIAMKRALTNLVTNGVSYGGAVQVTVTGDEREIVISVDDHGPGIAESELQTVFTPFNNTRTKKAPSSQGVGLGLSIVHAIVEDHGGRIELKNRIGGGLHAEIRIPSCEPNATGS